MPATHLSIHGARTHNLRDLSVDLPLLAWTVVTGVSGSGKSSLVLDTIGAESRRRYLGALARTRQGLDLVPRPDVDRIEGLPPAVLVGAAERAPGPLETVGTVTEASHALRSLFARAASPHCPTCGAALPALPRAQIVQRLAALPSGARLLVLVRLGRGAAALERAERAGYVRVRVQGSEGGASGVERVEQVARDRVAQTAAIDVVLDRLIVGPALGERLRDTVDHALALGDGVVRTLLERSEGPALEQAWSTRPWCGACDLGQPPLSVQRFSPTHPDGACGVCKGRGRVQPARAPGKRGARKATSARPGARSTEPAPGTGEVCAACSGGRLAPYPAAALLAGQTLPACEALPGERLSEWLSTPTLARALPAAARPALEEVRTRLKFLADLGLGDLALGRPAAELARGELRRVRLAAACAARMSGLLYVFDEPLAGCHPSERGAVQRRLRELVEEGNTVLSVEHDLTAVRAADRVLELGPGAGHEGGALVAEGTPAEVARGDTALGRALRRGPAPARSLPRHARIWAEVKGARWRNLAGLDVRFPTQGLTCVVGVSGAGKSTLVFDILAPLAQELPLPRGARGSLLNRGTLSSVSASDARVVRHPRATPLSLLRAFEPLRELFAQTLEARTRGWSASRFSLGVPGGRCEPCRGSGEIATDLGGLGDVHAPCEVCGGRRYAPDVEAVRVKGLSMPDALALSVAEGATLFRDVPRLGPPLNAALDVGLGYVPLGRPASRLSQGEVLRLRLSAALGRGATAATLYLLDEPAAGLHPDDVTQLVAVLDRLVNLGHAIVAVEHDPTLIATADHVIALGPGAGARGGTLLYEGPPAGWLTA